MTDEFDDEEEEFSKQAEGYRETACQTTAVKCCGSSCCVFLGLLIVAWVFHAIPVASITDAPAFARSLIWVSIAHHTDGWKEWQLAPPPPPSFGDGRGNF